MLKQAAILLAAIAITACGENAAVSPASVETATIQTAEEKKAATLIKATKAAIIIESYEVEENIVIPAKTSSAGGQDR